MPSVGSIANIGISVGISIFPVDGGELADLMGAADSALYEAKRACRNGFRFHQSTVNTQAKERAKREIQLRGRDPGRASRRPLPAEGLLRRRPHPGARGSGADGLR
jgi:predicted signal transduction protein with EAL and GGDEF domain